MKHLILTIFLAATVISCRSSGSLEEYYSESSDSLKIQILRSFTNIDYAKAGSGTDSARSSLCNSLPSYEDTPSLYYISTPDCSFCIAAALDFMYTVSISDLSPAVPAVAFKDGDTDVFEFYKDQYSKNLDSTTMQAFNSIRTIKVYDETLNAAEDGVYLVYRNRVLNYIPWPPQS